ncbi:hypothetical protein TNCV_1175311 [Trichonephila clavipes]|nr:hypothetical protein TNCV_1175311 [Trichonephila clavipes]
MRSQKPPHQNTERGVKLHVILWMKDSFSISSQSSFCSKFSASSKLVSLSLYITFSRPRLDMNHRRQRRKNLVVSNSTSSRCTAPYTAQVKRNIQLFSPIFRVSGPVQSPPLTSKRSEFFYCVLRLQKLQNKVTSGSAGFNTPEDVSSRRCLTIPGSTTDKNTPRFF